MRDPFVHHLDDPTGILTWLAQKIPAAGRPGAYSPPAAIVVPREPERAPEPLRILSAAEEWQNMGPEEPEPEETKPPPVYKPKAPAKHATHCQECKGPMPTLRKGDALYCSRGCKSVADHRKERMVPYDAESHRMLRMPT